MEQLNLYDYLQEEKELILCQLSSGFHWLRITSGQTPLKFKNRIHFQLGGFDHLYEGTEGKLEILSEFDGTVHTTHWEKSLETAAMTS